jgi:hypothetical protein
MDASSESASTSEPFPQDKFVDDRSTTASSAGKRNQSDSDEGSGIKDSDAATSAGDAATSKNSDPDSIGESAISDSPTDNDDLGFSPYVEAIATFLSSDSTQPPLTLSIEGDWGAGKSSFLRQLTSALKAKKFPCVSFNAWRHDKEDELWAAFALEFIRQLSGSMTWRQRLAANIRLFLSRFSWSRGLIRLVWTSGLLLLLFAVTFQILIYAHFHNGFASLAIGTTIDPQNLMRIGGYAAYIILLIGLLRQSNDLLGNPLAVDLTKYIANPDYGARVTFIETFQRDFALLLKHYGRGSKIFAFIDDLDRCEVPKAADLIQALNLLISAQDSRMIFILGMDREVVAAGLAAKYENILPYLFPGIRIDDGTLSLRGREYGYAFMEKFVQLPFQVPRPTDQNIDQMLDRINFVATNLIPPAPTSQAISRLVLSSDSPRVRSIVKMVAPVMDYNPRRLKQFINAFRLNSVIADRTGLFQTNAGSEPPSSLTLEQLGKFVAIRLRWPYLIEDLEVDRGLLRTLHRIATGVEMPTSTDKLSGYWTGVPPLMDLIRNHASEPELDHANYSLEWLDTERLMQVSPSVASLSARTRGPVPTSPSATGRSIDFDVIDAAMRKQGRPARPL